MRNSNKKNVLAEELKEIRIRMNELKRKERLLRDFFLEDLTKKNLKLKKYGDVYISLITAEKEKVDTDTLHLHYPEIYESLISTYEYTILKCF